MNTTNTRLKQTARLMSLNLMAAIEEYPHVLRVEMFATKAHGDYNSLDMIVRFVKQQNNVKFKVKDYNASFRLYSNTGTNIERDLMQDFAGACNELKEYSIHIDHKSLIPKPTTMGIDRAAEGAEMTVVHTQTGRMEKTPVGGGKSNTASRSLVSPPERKERLNMLALRFAANLVMKLSKHPEVYHIETVSAIDDQEGGGHTRVRIAWQGEKAINVCLYDSDEPTFDAFLAKVGEACNMLNARGANVQAGVMLRACGLDGGGIPPAWAVEDPAESLKPSLDADAVVASQQYQMYIASARRQGKTHLTRTALEYYSQIAAIPQALDELKNHPEAMKKLREHLKASMPSEFELPPIPDELVKQSKAAMEKKNGEHLKERLTNKDILETESKSFTSIRDTLR